MGVVIFFLRTTTNLARTSLLIIVTVNIIARIISKLKDEIYINIIVFILQLSYVWKTNLGRGNIYIDYYMAFFISYPLSTLGHDISPRADRLKG